MINASKEFQLLMNQRTDFKQNAEITFADGKSIVLIEKDFTVSNNSVVDGSESNGIPLGVAVCRNIQIELMNDDDRFSEYDFFGAKIRLYLTFQLSDTVESIEYGTFTVLTPETYGTTVIITALDDMYKADKYYETTLDFPATIRNMWIDACTTLGISVGTTTFLNDDFWVDNKPTDITFRQLFGYISMIAGGNARVDRTGRLCIVTYDFSNMESIYTSVLNGGSYNPWDNPVNIDGGSFAPWNEGDVADGGEFGDRKHFHVLGNWKDLKVDTDDVVITGVQTVYTDESNNEQTVLYGSEGYVLSFENPLIVGKEETAVELIGNVMVGGRFRQFSGDMVANPTCEFMDTALLLDRKGNVYISFITDVNFQFFGYTSIKNSAEPTLRNSAKGYSEAARALIKAKKLIDKERTAREQAVAQLAKYLKESSGLFATEEEQPDGSIIYYMHDKPTLAESMIIWKLTSLAFGISTDGGKTYPYGFTINGEIIARLLYAEGINADYINTGALKISDKNGNTLFSADYDKKEVYINASNVKIGTKSITDELVEMAATISLVDNKVELKASKGELSSLLSVESGEVSIKSNRFLWESTNSSLSSDGKLTAKNVDLTGKITADKGEIGGFTIGSSSIYNGKSILTSGSSGIYIGTDGISVGGYLSKPAFKLTADGDLEINSTGTISFSSSSYSMKLSASKIEFGTSAFNTEITHEHVKVYNNYIDKDRIRASSSTGVYTELTWQEIKAYSSVSSHCELDSNSLTFANSDTFVIYAGTTSLVSLYKGHCTYGGDIASLGKSNGKIGFFGVSSPSNTKQTVSNITTPSSATASTIATKLNELLTALRSYNLIG